ncbi:phage tail tip lysozyme [Mesorhizobium australafricanum]|uniref:Phage tail tip lysozyme n=1 Tax=Mesorhizobium australafricanum TaxID=3072311 RepID=A0ABU4WRL1_9HYPH|nr:phage tail tip lysozyme [Mesorhizobium sp. VK3E]MDX8438363.1 phage tail tip lysozyme [Mesorhizobium sp. VK3E]
MTAPMFIFGGDTGVKTPEDLARLRAIAQALSQPSPAPRSVGQGLNALGEAIGYRMAANKATAAEQDWRKGGDSVFSALFGGGSSPAGSGSSAVASALGGGSGGNLPTVDVSKSVAGAADPKALFAGLKARGLNDAQAYATLGNWKQESEFRPGAINPGEGALGFTQWREGRRASLENFARATGRSASDPETQMDFFVREAGVVPDTTGTVTVDHGAAAFAKANDIQSANSALKGFIRYGSPYDKGGEGTRLANALAYQKLFGGSDAPVQVASIDPSAGVAQATGGQPVSAQTPAQALARQPVSPRTTEPAPVVSRPAAPAPVPAQASPAPIQVAGGPSMQQLLQASQDPRLSDQQRAVVNLMLKQKLEENNPANQLELQKNRADLEKTQLETERLRNPTIAPADQARIDLDRQKFDAEQNKPIEVGGVLVDPKTHQAVYTGQQTDWEKLDERTLYNKRTGETKAIGSGANAGQFRFSGNSVEAQALNGLMDSGGLTPDQAQQLGAGKTITGPNGELIFMTPQGVFGQAKPGGPAIPLSPQAAPQSQAAPAAGPAQAPAAPAAPVVAPTPVSPRADDAPTGADRPGMIPLTDAKVKPPNEQQQRDNKLYSVVAPELSIVEQNFDALSNPKDQALSAIPHGSDYGTEYLKSPQYQRASNSLRTIIASYLYSVSGATAAPAEVENQAAILTPKPGEAKASLDDKLARIRQMVDAIKTGGSGPAQAPAGTGGGTLSNGLKWSIEP